MARRRGFFAELQHQAAVAERDRQRAHAASARLAQSQQREAERAYAAAQRAEAAAARADAYAYAAAEREAKRLHVAAQEAHVEALNSELASQLTDIDSVLTWTLSFDDHVDLEELRQVAEHPPFTSPHEVPLPPPPPITVPPEPTFVEPAAPTGLGAVFSKKKHAAAVEEARGRFGQQYAAWQAEAAAVPMRQLDQMNRYQAAEAERVTRLAADRAVYDEQCRQRQEQIDAQNAELDQLIARLEAGDQQVVEDYFGIVFGNSVYPDVISVDVDHSYRADEKELELAVHLPSPGDIPSARSYRYVKAKDEIVETSQTAKEQRDRYTNLVFGIVLRTLHEVWESDRLGHVDTIALTAGVDHIDPATGRMKTTPLVAVAVDRSEFEAIDLAHVTPAETLKHLKAVVSKNPHALAPIELTSGVRG
jgi:restriction system protein